MADSLIRWDNPSSRSRPLIRFGLVGLVFANLAFNSLSTFLSVHNYPGGEVWEVLEKLQKGSNDTRKLPLALVRADKQ
jgi:alpha-1,6-mannosyltransferase